MARNNLQEAMQLLQRGQDSKAKRIIQGVLKRAPGSGDAHRTLGIYHLKQGALKPAQSAFRKALKLQPRDDYARSLLAGVDGQLGDPEGAIRLADEVISRHPAAEAAWNAKFNALMTLRRIPEALEAMRQAARQAPGTLSFQTNLARAASQVDAQEAAVRAWEHCLTLPGADVVNLLSKLIAAAPGLVSVDVEQAFRTLSPEVVAGANPQDLAYLESALLLNRSNHNEAFDRLSGVNARIFADRRDSYSQSLQVWTKTLDALRSLPDGETPRDAARTPAAAVFITGASRSGKTTVERLLATDPNVHACFENSALLPAIRGLAERSGRPTSGLGLTLIGQPARDFAADFLAHRSDRSAGKRLVTDTNPGSILYLEPLMREIPSVRTISIQRDADDVAYRQWFTEYGNSYEYSYDLAASRDHTAMIEAIQAELHRLFPDRCLLVRYADLVGQTGAEAARICAFLGLEAPAEIPEIPDDRGFARNFSRA